jgi:hypothetical protein
MTEIEHYGESLESHPGFLFMKKMWLEDQIDLEKDEDSLIFVDPPKINSKELFKGINLILTKNKDEENILRDPLGNSQTG